MILKIFAFKDKLLGCYCNPIYDDHDTEVFSTTYRRSLIKNVDELKGKYKNLQCYWLGVFNDESGIIESQEPVLLFDCDELLKEVNKNGKNK